MPYDVKDGDVIAGLEVIYFGRYGCARRKDYTMRKANGVYTGAHGLQIKGVPTAEIVANSVRRVVVEWSNYIEVEAG